MTSICVKYITDIIVWTTKAVVNHNGICYVCQSQSRRAFVALDDLRHRGFKQDNGQFVVELEMRNIKNTFEQVRRIATP